MKCKIRFYYCGLCGKFSKHETNHTREIYTPCRKCGNSVLYCATDNRTEVPVDAVATVNYYRYDISKPEQHRAYKELYATLLDLDYVLFDCLPSKHEYLQQIKQIGFTVNIFKINTFKSQYITNVGRLHEWYEEIFPNKDIKSGYFLTIKR